MNLTPFPVWRSLVLAAATLAFLIAPLSTGMGQPPTPDRATPDKMTSSRLEFTSVALRDSVLRVSVRNIDITRFPLISVAFDVFTPGNLSVNGLHKMDVKITENGQPQPVITLSTITRSNRVPVDFVFAIDQTGSMGNKIDGVKQNIDEFTTRLTAKGIDYRLGLIVFDDYVAERHWLTDNLSEFKRWIDAIKAHGGGDEPENALEAMRAATGMNFRSSANRCVVIVTDASLHQYGEHGYGRTMYTPSTMAVVLNRNELRTFCIVNPAVPGYKEVADATGGQVFDINKPFAEILNDFATTMTSLYVATYESDADQIPDSIEAEVKLPGRNITVRKKFAVLEVGRKLVVNNIHFPTNRSSIDIPATKELDYLIRLMNARPSLKLKIEGHTDDVGEQEANMQLSHQRAEAVKRYMVRGGISPNRLYTIGYGELRPTAGNDTPEGQHLNRRTEFIIVQR